MMTSDEYRKKTLKKRARMLQKSTGMKYTQALREVTKQMEENK